MATNIQTGDRVGIALKRIKNGVELEPKIVCQGIVTRIWRATPRGNWRADVLWDDPQKSWLYTGKDGWEYLSALTLVLRELNQPIRRGRPIEQKRGYRGKLS